MVTMVVTPPAAAARLPLSSVSRCSPPGSPTKTRMSTRPGRIASPRQSTISAPSGAPWFAASGPAATMRPSTTRTAPRASSAARGIDHASVGEENRRGHATSPTTLRKVLAKRLQHRHAHRHAHLDLLADDALQAVGDQRVDLDAAVHRAWMHDDGVRLGVGELFGVEAPEAEIFAHAGHIGGVHALALQAAASSPRRRPRARHACG